MVTGQSSPRCLLSATRLDLLDSFVVLAEELHVGRASVRLFMTQSGLSRRLAALETQLGVALFDRTTRRVVLSQAGLVLLPHAKRLLGQALEASRELHEIRLGGAAPVPRQVPPLHTAAR